MIPCLVIMSIIYNSSLETRLRLRLISRFLKEIIDGTVWPVSNRALFVTNSISDFNSEPLYPFEAIVPQITLKKLHFAPFNDNMDKIFWILKHVQPFSLRINC